MRERKSQNRFQDADQTQDRAEDDRGPVVIALMAAAISGFFVGLVIDSEFTFAAAVAVLVPATGCAGWWLRSAFVRDGLRVER